MKILFAGTSEIGSEVLRTLFADHDIVGVLTQPDRPAGQKRLLQAPPIKKLLQEISPSTPLFQPEKLRDPLLIEKLQALAPDVMITFSYGKILPREILELPRLACLNIHTSLLPLYRGASPIQAAIAAGDKETGVTIMHMAEGLDTGDILLTEKLLLDPQETTGSLTQRLAALSPSALLEALTLIKQGKAPRLPQEEACATHTHCLHRSDALLDWSQPAVVLERKIRAMNPSPGAHGVLTLSPDKKISLKIFSATVISQENLPTDALPKEPGSLAQTIDKKFIILRGNGALLLQEIQPEGRSRMNFSDFSRGHLRE